MPIFDKDKRHDRRDKRYENIVTSEASKIGVDLKKPIDIGPMGNERKAAIDKDINTSLSEDERGRFKRFSDMTTAPVVDTPIIPDKEQLKANVKEQRKARWWDALYAFGEGLQGRTADPKIMRSKQLAAERMDMLNQYKDSFKAGKDRLNEWEGKYRSDAINYLDEIINDPNTPELKRIKAQQQNEILKGQQLRNKRTQQEIDAAAKNTTKDKKDTKIYQFPYKTADGETLKINTSKEEYDVLNSLTVRRDKLRKKLEAKKAEHDTNRKKLEDKKTARDIEMMQAKGDVWFGDSKDEKQQAISNKYQSDIDKLQNEINAIEYQSDIDNLQNEINAIESDINTKLTPSQESNPLDLIYNL